MIITIVNTDLKYGIGKNNDLLFHLPKDMEFFRKTTTGHVVAMGENTLLSFPGKSPLKNRTNIVLSFEKDYENVVNVHSFDKFIEIIKNYAKTEDVYIIGGASIYKQTLPYVDQILLTRVHEIKNADVFFPNLDEHKEFELIEESDPIIDNDHKITFCKYIRK